MSFRHFRILLLLTLLGLAGGVTAWDRYTVRGWREPLRVEIRPIVGDARAETAAYVKRLVLSDFLEIEQFLNREAGRHGVPLARAVRLSLLPASRALPPAQPAVPGVLSNIAWSLKMRWWSYRDSGRLLPGIGVVKLYVIHRAPADGTVLPHSLGLEKGLIGVVHAWAEPRAGARNRLVLAHELLHTLGATDKYDPASQRPRYPDGYAEPARLPLYPQVEAEIMAGRVPRSEARAVAATGLGQTRIGVATAREIGLDEAFGRYWGRRG